MTTDLSTEVKLQQPDAPLHQDPDIWLFISGDQVVGRVSADCCVCAWKDGSKRWPGTQMAMTWTANETRYLEGEICLRRQNQMKRDYRHESK